MFENDEVFEIMRKSYLEYGNKVLMDKNRLSAYMVDLLVEYTLERKRLLLAVNENIIYKMIREIGCYDSARFSMLSSELVQIYEIPEEMANYIVSFFHMPYLAKKHRMFIKKLS